MELQETELEDQTHQIVEVLFTVHLLWLETFLETALGEAIVAGVKLEGRQVILNNVAIDVNACFQMVQFVVTRVPLEYLGADTFIGSEEP